jgi:hypothetical protein
MDAITMETARLPAIDLNNRGQAEWERWLAQALGPGKLDRIKELACMWR